MEDETEEANVTNASDSDNEPRVLTPPPVMDYMAMLDRDSTEQHVLGVLNAALNTLDYLWSEGLTELVVSLAWAMEGLDTEGDSRAMIMSSEAIRRFTACYRRVGAASPLPPFWRTWIARVTERLREDTEHFPSSSTSVAASESTGEDHSLMQTSGRRLTGPERALRPRRPQEWADIVQRLRSLLPAVASRVLTIARSWITSRINTVGHVFVSLGLMLRDTLNTNEDVDVPAAVDVRAREVAGAAVESLNQWMDRHLRMDLRPTHQYLVQEAIRQAVKMDEVDLSLFPTSDEDRASIDLEEVHLMYRTNNLIRDRLDPDTRTRENQIGMLHDALKQQIGTSARHLRRLGICLHGVQMIGIRKRKDVEEGLDAWLAELMDEIHMIAATEVTGVSIEDTWDRELLGLRRWLAEDMLCPKEEVSDEDQENAESPTPTEEEEQEEVTMVQKGLPPWKRDGPRATRSTPRRRRRGRAARERSREQRDRESNSHRPWRTSTTRATPRTEPSSPARVGPSSGPRITHPAAVALADGTHNAGIHCWHAMLGLVNPSDPPERVDYGLTGYQQDNIRTSLEDMSMRERFQMITSFLHMTALLISEVADIAEAVVPDSAPEEEGDETELMERFIVKTTSPSPPGGNQLARLFGNPFELELRSLVSAMELSDVTVARRRAEAMLQRIALRFKTHTSRDDVPEAVEQMESAMVTFAPRVEVGQIIFSDLPAEDQDFVEYWWGILFRRLKVDDAALHASVAGSGEERVQERDTGDHKRKTHAHRETLDEDELDLATEELDLMRRMDEQETRKKHRVAEDEYQRFQDSQEKDVQQEADTWLREKEAARYQAWEDWQMNEALTESRRAVLPGRFRLRLQGTLSSSASSSSGRQSMEWELLPRETLCLQLQVDRQCPDSREVGVQSEARGMTNVSTQKYEPGETRPASASMPTERAVTADDAEGQGVEEGSTGMSALQPAKGWGVLTASHADVVIEDSQLP